MLMFGRSTTTCSLSTNLYALFARPRPVAPAGGRADINESRAARYGAKLQVAVDRFL